MKKSFMTRVLAAGLSFAMAFSMAAATNVTTASAASKPKMITSSGASAKTLDVKLGEAVKIKVNASTKKTYKVSKAKVSSSKLRAAVNKAGTVVTIRGLKATDEGKPASVKVSFSVKKTGKTSKYSYVSKVNVIEDKLTMTAEATKVKQITVTFNKEVDTIAAKITVKKGTATPTVSEVKFDETKKVATLAMAGKLTKGTYTVTAVVGDETLTADAIVEKDETLTSFALVGNTLKADPNDASAGAIEYKALNQYEEAMACSTAKVTIAPGTADPAVDTKPTSSKAGKYGVKSIPTIYTVPGSEFSVVIVDSQTGVNFNGKVVYGASAKPAKVESVGLYNVNKSKFADMFEGDTISNFVALFKVTDQYGDAYKMSVNDVKTSTGQITAVAASGVSNVKVGDFDQNNAPLVTVGDDEYFAIPLTNVESSRKTAVEGTFSLTIVNSNIGVIGTPSYNVTDKVVISSIEISSDAIYAEQDNEMSYVVTDTNGNNVTDFATLNGIKIGANGDGKGSDNGTLKWSKKADGTAKLTYHPTKVASGLKSSIETFTITANDVTSSKYLVKTITFTKLEKRKPVAVVGISSKVATTTAQTSAQIDVELKNLLIEDQYGNVFTEDELKGTDFVANGTVYVTGANISNGATAQQNPWVAKSANMPDATGAAIDASKKVTFIAPTTSAAVTAKYNFFVKDNKNEQYTLKLSKVAGSAMKSVTDLAIDSINDGYAVYATQGALTASFTTKAATGPAVSVPVVVSGKVNGQKVYMTASECEAEFKAAALGESNKTSDNKTETATLIVYVTTEDGPVKLEKEFTISNIKAPAAATKVAKVDSYTTKTVSGGALATTIKDAAGAYKAYDMYGNVVADADSTKYDVTVTEVLVGGVDKTASAENGTEYTLTKNGMNSASFTTANTVTINVVVTLGDSSVSYKVKVHN